MATTINLINNTIEQVKPIFNSIQKRYIDPYKIILSTNTNTQNFVEKDVNQLVSSIVGNNVVIEGLDVTSVTVDSSGNATVSISKGKAVVDNTLIEFTDNMTIKVPASQIDTTGTYKNSVFLVYRHVESYPPNIAYINVFSENNIPSDYNSENTIILKSFTINDTTVKFHTRDEVTINVNGTPKKPSKKLGTITDIHDLVSLNTLQSTVCTRSEFEKKAEIVRRLAAGSGFVEWGGTNSTETTGDTNWNSINLGMQVATKEHPYFGQDFVEVGGLSYENPVIIGKVAFLGSLYSTALNRGTPIVNVNGYLLKIYDGLTTGDVVNPIKFPDPPSSPDQPYRQDLIFLELH